LKNNSMENNTLTRSTLAAAAAVLGAAATAEAAKKPHDKKPAPAMPKYKGAPDPAALEKAFEVLKSFNWGHDPQQFNDMLGAIEAAVPASHGDEAARKELATKLAAVVASGASRAAKDYACRKLLIIGTTVAIEALAALLTDKELSHMGRYALERIQAPEAAKALRDALAKTSGAQKAGVAGSIGARRDVEAISDLAALLADSDALIALAAATALGDIGTLESAKALADAKPTDEQVKMRVADARLTAAEKLLAVGDREAAKAVYTMLKTCPTKSVKLAAIRGLGHCN
jgi:HEAT repeat protein